MFIQLVVIIFIAQLASRGDDFVQRIKERLEKVETIHATLTQTYRWEGFETAQSFAGEIWLKRPNRLRLRLVNKEEHHLIVAGDTIWVYTPELKQAILTYHPSEIILEIFDLENYATEAKHDERCALILTPREENPYVQEMTLYVGEESLMVERIIMKDVNGNTTEWKFDEIQVNGEIADSLFHFSPPPGVETIEE